MMDKVIYIITLYSEQTVFLELLLNIIEST